MTDFLHSAHRITSHAGINNSGAIFMSCVCTLHLLETSSVAAIKVATDSKNSLARKSVTFRT
jgi:hypothetical protein